jgi:hypothetical protein
MAAAGVSIERAEGTPVVPDWFPLAANLRVLDDIGRTFGDAAVVAIGFSVPEHARFPPRIRTLQDALAALDVAFHSNHRCDGAVMFDAATGHMLEGIGHYRCDDGGSDGLVSESTSVYPCSFDLGLVSGLVARFDPGAKVEHPSDGLCRTRGAVSCRYVVVR